ncbi:MAG: matrixin family metalloprotease, partial [Candidatus Hodarchaeota archaeon]
MAQTLTAVQGGVNAWQNVTPADLNLTETAGGNVTRDPNDGLNTIYWAELGAPEFGGLAPILGPNIFAVTIITIDANQVLQDVDIPFNGRDWVWTVSGAANVIDVQSIATHEIGHGIGIHHSTVAGATMVGGYGGGPGPRTLAVDDQDAINFLYPPPGPFQFLPCQDRAERKWYDYKTLAGDVNGDGRTDLIWNETKDINRTYVGLARADGTFQFLPRQDRAERGWSDYKTLAGDVNGDGRTDLIWNETKDI